jgi:mannonate dehydratase
MGVDTVLGTIDGVKKFDEMLDDPGAELADVIRWFGSRDKIFNVHFRNILGHKLDFMETFPDEGSIDFTEIY